ncbi:MAG: hypothetical protein ACTSUR_04320 [Candidatus Heimdallarchaeaceae archaeon]
MKYRKFDQEDPLDITLPSHHIIIVETELGRKVGLIWLAKKNFSGDLSNNMLGYIIFILSLNLGKKTLLQN